MNQWLDVQLTQNKANDLQHVLTHKVASGKFLIITKGPLVLSAFNDNKSTLVLNASSK